MTTSWGNVDWDGLDMSERDHIQHRSFVLRAYLFYYLLAYTFCLLYICSFSSRTHSPSHSHPPYLCMFTSAPTLCCHSLLSKVFLEAFYLCSGRGIFVYIPLPYAPPLTGLASLLLTITLRLLVGLVGIFGSLLVYD